MSPPTNDSAFPWERRHLCRLDYNSSFSIYHIFESWYPKCANKDNDLIIEPAKMPALPGGKHIW